MRSLSYRLVLLLLLLALFNNDVSATDTGTDVGKYAPAVELLDLNGKTISLSSLKGTAVLLNFWSTLCVPCVEEMPSLNRLSSAFKDSDFRVIAVSIDASDKPVRDFVLKNKISFTILLDKDKEVFFDQYAGPTLPASYLIDRNGLIVDKYTGKREWDSAEIRDKIYLLLRKK